MPNAQSLLVDVISRRAWRLYRRIGDTTNTIDSATTPSRIHDVRITAKKLRYLVDVRPAAGDARDSERLLVALKKLQRVLGDFNDAHVQEHRLLECGRTLGGVEGRTGALLTIGRLAEQSRQRGESLRQQVRDELVRFGAHETRSACRRTFRKVAVEVNTP